MTFVEILQTALPLFVYFALFILLVVLIVLTIKLIATINKLNVVVDDVNKKVKSLDGIFGLIDFATDKITLVTNKFVDRLSNLVLGFKNKKYNKKEEEEDNE